MSELCRQPVSARDVLRMLISAPGILAGRDLISGDRYPRLHVDDVEDFVDAHLQGPGRHARPPCFTVADEAGERRVKSFVRPEVLPTTNDGKCTHVVVSVRTANAKEPDDGLLAMAIALREQPAHLLLERSVLTGVWNLWFVFPSPIMKEQATAVAHCIRRTLEIFGTPSFRYAIPLLEGDGKAGTLLPCPFYRGDFLGILFGISPDAYLMELPIEPRGDGDAPLEALLSSWCAVCPGRYARAEGIISKLSERGMLTEPFGLVAPRSAALLLGRQLTSYARHANGRFAVVAKQSGHSNRYLVTPRNRSLS